MRFHVLGLPLATTRANSSHIFVAKVRNFVSMMLQRGHEVIHYGTEGSSVPSEHVDVGPSIPGPIDWNVDAPHWNAMNRRAAPAILERAKPHDFVCVFGGKCQRDVAEIVSCRQVLPIEIGVGYLGSGCFAKHRIFESYSHMHQVYGQESPDPDGKFYDAVIPCSFDLDQFPVVAEGAGKYALFLGRVIHRKGIGIAIEATARAGVSLVIAGPGAAHRNGKILCDDGSSFVAPHVRYVGPVGTEQRAKLLGDALCLLAPTHYVEPFGAVAVEAQLCGTPAITTDWGAFTETVEHGRGGFRCHTLEEFAVAIRNAPFLFRVSIAKRARERYSLERVGKLYEHHFFRLAELWGDGWNAVYGVTGTDGLDRPAAFRIGTRRAVGAGARS